MSKEQLEIKRRIDLNNQIIQQAFNPNIFTLNNTVAELLAENKALQDTCQHEYEDGYCIYCYKAEVEE